MRLPDPDPGEQRAERDERHEQRAREPVGEGRSGDDRESGDEREDEERERDRSRTFVPGPQERRRGERDEGGERQGDQERGRLGALAPEDPVPEREDGGGDREVEREEQERLLLAELHGKTERCDCEQRDRHDGRVAGEGHGARDDDGDADAEERHAPRLVHEQPEVVATDERPRQPTACAAQEHEARQGKDASPGHEHEECAERPHERSHLSSVCVLHGRRTLRRGGLGGVAEPALGLGELRRDTGDCVRVSIAPLLGARRGQGRACPVLRGRRPARAP